MYDITTIPRTKRTSKTYLVVLGFLCSLLFTNCSPIYRFERLLQKHPYLATLYAKDSIAIKTYEDVDTIFVLSSEKDTLFFNDTKLYRTSDTIRLIRTFKPCTTYVSKNISIPQKTIERERWQVYPWDTRIIILLCIILLIVIFVK